jgi:hypothetical protein
MKKVVLVVLAAFLVTGAWAYITLEDFQSYSDGQDIASSPNWTNLEPPNEIHCADLGGGVKVGVFFPGGGELWSYSWDASDHALNYGVSADFAYTAGAENPTLVLAARFSGDYPVYWEIYAFTIQPNHDPVIVDISYHAYNGSWVDENLWTKNLDITIQPDEWHNICGYVHGENPVTFQVYFDDVKIGSHVETEYLAPAGRVGLSAFEINDTYDLMVDNVTQENANTAVAPASLGQLKAVFY